MQTQATDFLYLDLASRLEKLISKDAMRPGEKLPSIRTISKEEGLSMGTVFQAFYHLESKGLIEARPKSGYFVRIPPKRQPKLPGVCEPVAQPQNVNVRDMIARIYGAMYTPNLLSFAVATPSAAWLPSAKLNKAMVQSISITPESGLAYPDVQGSARLRHQVAQRSFLWGGSLADSDILITNGCMEAIALSLKAVTKPGDTIALESPVYFGIFQLAESLGLRVLELPTDPTTGVDLDYLAQAIVQHRINACLFVPNFNNPLGCCMPDDRKKALVELLALHEVPLVEDDIYGDLYFGDHRPRTCKSFDQKGLVLLCSSFSKTLAPGYRVGWVAPGPRYYDTLRRLKMCHSVANASLPQEAIGLFLENGRYEHHLRQMRLAMQGNIQRFTQAVCSFFPSGTRVSRPQGGFVLWIELPAHIDTFALYQESIKHNISIAPGRIFSLQERYHHCFRLSCGEPWSENVEAGLKILGQLVKGMLG